MTLFGDKVFAEVLKLEWAHTPVGPNPTNITGIFYKSRNVDTDTEEDNVKTQAEDSHPEVKEKGLERIFPSQSSQGTKPSDKLPVCRTVGK